MEWLNYHHLRYFWVVAREGSLVKASKRLRVSQPSISVQIRELENALGQPLFERKGRRNVLTDAGRIAFRYAEDIFSAGQELVTAIKHRPEGVTYELNVGVADSLPKLVTYVVLKPILAEVRAAHIVCREGKVEDLLVNLAEHRIDILLCDEPSTSGAGVRAFNHLLGESGVSFCAAPGLAVTLRRGFPKSLHGAPALLPLETNVLRRSLEQWFQGQGIQPRVVAEVQDSALLKVMAAHQVGFLAVPKIVADEATKRYGLEVIGETEDCRERFYAVTAERRITHPLVSIITENARKLLLG